MIKHLTGSSKHQGSYLSFNTNQMGEGKDRI